MSIAPIPPADELHRRFLELRSYVGLSEDDISKAIAAWELVRPDAHFLVEDFYAEILRHPDASRVFSGPDQVERLKRSLHVWLGDLFSGHSDHDFAARRWQTGFRHVQIGLPSIWVNVAMSRLRDRFEGCLTARWQGTTDELLTTRSAVGRMFDIDLALIQDAYNAESVARKLHRERDFAEGVIQTAQAVVMVVDGAGRILRGNAFLNRLLGDERALSADAPVIFACDLMATEECEPFLEFLRAAAEGRNPSPMETDLRHSASTRRRVRWMARPYLMPPTPGLPSDAPGSEEASVLCVGQDITDLTEAQRLLVRHARLAAIGQTMTGLAHESRNAFQRSQAALETLLLELEDRPAAVQLIERIQRAHDHLLHLYEEVLQFARPVRLELQTFHLDGVVRQTWEHLEGAVAAKQLRCELQSEAEISAITADPFAVEQIVRNLLENAIEASPSNTHLELTVQRDWLGSHAAVKLQVRDFGRGIPEKYRDRLFEPFFTTRPRGTGLGLPIARRLAEGHGGSLDLQPAEPGTVAILVLPIQAIPESEESLASEDTRRS